MDENLIICRCEEIALAEIKEAIANGLTSVSEIRKFTRGGMGLCQGRTCQKLIQRVLKEQGISSEDETILKTRSPVMPITLGEIVNRRND